MEHNEHAQYDQLTEQQQSMVEEIIEFGQELGRRPKLEDVNAECSFSQTTIYRHFESYTQLLEFAGFDYQPTHSEPKIPDEELLEDIRTVAEKIGQVPSHRDMRRHGQYSHWTYSNRFESWDSALKKADLSQEYGRRSSAWIAVGELIDEMLRVADLVDRPPRQVDMRERGKFSDAVYKRRFGSWGEAHEYCGLPPRKRIALSSEKESDHFDYGRNWEEVRTKVLVRDRWRCQDCGLSNREHVEEYDRSLQVHHLIPLREFGDPEDANFGLNLITLCANCHSKWEDLGRTALSIEE